MQEEAGYVLIMTVVIIAVITMSIAVMGHRVLFGASLTMHKIETIQALPLAESAALEGLWRLNQQPDFRSGGERHWDDCWYRFSIIDPTAETIDDLELQIIGEGFVENQRSAVRLHVTRDNPNAQFEISLWEEYR